MSWKKTAYGSRYGMDPCVVLSSRQRGKDIYAVEMDLFADWTAYGSIIQWTYMQLSSRQYPQTAYTYMYMYCNRPRASPEVLENFSSTLSYCLMT